MYQAVGCVVPSQADGLSQGQVVPPPSTTLVGGRKDAIVMHGTEAPPVNTNVMWYCGGRSTMVVGGGSRGVGNGIGYQSLAT